jgi:hypothetical protein
MTDKYKHGSNLLFIYASPQSRILINSSSPLVPEGYYTVKIIDMNTNEIIVDSPITPSRIRISNFRNKQYLTK